MMYLQISSEVTEERNFSKCQKNDKYDVSQGIREFVKDKSCMYAEMYVTSSVFPFALQI